MLSTILWLANMFCFIRRSDPPGIGQNTTTMQSSTTYDCTQRLCIRAFAASRYTGKERDTKSGFDHFGARHYSSTMGRFMSPDPSGLYFVDPTNPQSLNLYSYVLNNPLINTDPDGKECVWDDGSYDIPGRQLQRRAKCYRCFPAWHG